MSGSGKVVCVTDAPGYVASSHAQRGFTGRPSVRDLGPSIYPNATVGWVNVKDVAMVLILAFEIPSASGRYCLVAKVANCSETVKSLREEYLAFELPEK